MAEFLRLAGDAVKNRETAIQANDNYFLFNEAQCRRLWQNLSAASCAFATSVTYFLPVQQKCLPLYKEFYNIVLRADEIAGKCSDKESWLREAIFLGGNRQVFQELSADLHSCMRNFHYLTKSLYLDSQIPAPSSVIDVAIPEAESDEDLHKLDVTSLMRRLKEREVDFDEQEKHLASYIVERGIFHDRVPEPEPDNLDPGKPRKLLFFEVHRQDPVHVKNLADGGSGIVVSEVMWLGLTCAMKEFLYVEDTVDFVKEVSALAALSHSRTVKLICSNREVPNPYIIMELMPMTLEKYCKRNNASDASDSMRFEILPSINMMLQISSGMEYLHENGVVHRDLKSLNILVRELHHGGLCSEGSDVDVKLTDFGLAKVKVPEESMEATCKRGTTKWSAPEVLGIPPNPPKHDAISPDPRNPRIDWRKADTYSFAVVCSEILTGQIPYSGIWEFQRSIDRVISGDLRPELPKDCPPYLSEFLSRCWAHNPKDRPTFKEITETLSEFKTSLQIGTVPELTRVRKVPLLMGLMAFLGVRKSDAYVHPQVWCPDSKERRCVEAAVEYIFGRMEIMEALCSEMKEHRKMVEICHVQCDHLVKSYLEGFQKVRAMLKHVSPKDFWNLYTSEKLKKFSESMDGLICSTMAVAEVVRACGGSEWMITALTIFAILPEGREYCSIFGLHLWNLYWNLFVIDHAMHDVTARQPSTSLQLLSTSNTLVLQKVTSTGHEDGDGEFLRADADRRAEDRKNLIISLSRVNDSPFSWFALICSSWFLSPVVPLKNEPAVFLRNRLESPSGPRDLDSYELDGLKLEAGKVIGRGLVKTVHKQKWCGELVAVSTLYCSWYQRTWYTRELRMLAKLQHPNVVQFIGWKLHHPNIVQSIGWRLHDMSQRVSESDVDICAVGYAVTELMEQDLRQLIERNTRLYSRSPFSLLVAIDILLQIVEAMIHIHKCEVIYWGLKPSNILVRPKYTANSNAQDLDVYYTVKLTDFLLAEMNSDSSIYQTYTRYSANWYSECPLREIPEPSDCIDYMAFKTPAYMAPEVLNSCHRLFERSAYSAGTYSFGMVAYEVTTGLTPFKFESVKPPKSEELRLRVNLGERPPFPDDYATGLKELIEKCWSGVPEDRPSFEQIRKDLWTLKYHESIAR